MPDSGDQSAPTEAMAGSSACACASERRVSATPLPSAGRGDRVEDRQLLGPRGRDELAGLRVGNRVAKAQVVDALPALDTEPRLEAARGIVDAGMDDLAVAARRLHAVLRVSVEDDDVRALTRQAGRDGEADDAGPDDDDLGVRHRSILRQR